MFSISLFKRKQSFNLSASGSWPIFILFVDFENEQTYQPKAKMAYIIFVVLR